MKLYDVTQQKSEVIVESKNDKFFQASSYEFSNDKKFILTASSIIKMFRHSFVAEWDIYDVDSQLMIPITINNQAVASSLVKFSPADNSLIIVHQNNIYYKRSPTEAEIQITFDGSTNSNSLVNGVPDWVYEEEVFASNSATWFSPDGKKIAFMQFNDTQVHLMTLPIYGRVGDPDFQYPQNIGVNYPKVASKNPEVKLFYVDLANVQPNNPSSIVLHEIAVPERFQTSHIDHLITSVSWATNNDLIAVFMNRVQNKGEIRKCIISNDQPDCREARNLDVTGGWIDFFSAPFYNKDGSSLIYIGSSNDYSHILALNLNSFVLTPRTSGNFVVTEILAFNKEENVIIFTANTEEDIKAQHIYAVKNEDNAAKVCLTCAPSSSYTYFTAEVSKDGNNLVITSQGPDVPQVHMYSINVTSTNITLLNHVELQSNNDLKRSLDRKIIPKVIYDKIVLENGSESQVMMALPSDLDENKKYPLLVEVYGGPDSSSVTNKWSIEWGTYLASAHNVIYAKIDGRGSGLRGDKNLFSLYRNLGTVEIHDQIETTEKLQKKYQYIDASKSAIWGWSYGGYVSGMSLATDENNVFKCAVSVAPGKTSTTMLILNLLIKISLITVTDWTLYDSIYTERYMGLPTADDNADGYTKSRLMNYVDNISKNNKTYMLVHGTLDDNVHFQQGMLLARTLERRDIQFKEITYPDEDHSLAGVRPHLYHSLEKFFTNCFADTYY